MITQLTLIDVPQRIARRKFPIETDNEPDPRKKLAKMMKQLKRNWFGDTTAGELHVTSDETKLLREAYCQFEEILEACGLYNRKGD